MNNHKRHSTDDTEFEQTQRSSDFDGIFAVPLPIPLDGGDPLTPPSEMWDSLNKDADAVGGEWEEPEVYRGSIGRTMFDTPSSQDNSITVLLPRDSMDKVPAQSLVRIHSVDDHRWYQGVVVEGPFAEPDGIRGDSPLVVTTTVRGGIFMPKFHGRVQVELLGEEIENVVMPPRFRPLPNSPVFALNPDETRQVLRLQGDIRIGIPVGYEELDVRIPSDRKSVLPRHIGILGTTGGGKSTTVSGLVNHFQERDIATVLIDTEGEYTVVGEATTDPTMQVALQQRHLPSKGIENTHIYHLVGRDTSNPDHPSVTPFCLQFSTLSPHLVTEVLELTEAQEQRYLKAYDITKMVLRELKVSPRDGEDHAPYIELDEMETGYPRMTLAQIYDIIQACASIAEKAKDDAFRFYDVAFREKDKVLAAIKKHSEGIPGNVPSWRALQGKLGRIRRLKIFDNPQAEPLDYRNLTQSGRVSIIDLSDTDSPMINNLVIAELLRGVQLQQNEEYARTEKAEAPPPRTMVIIEEAHEFLSSNRIKQMPVLFQQVARIARRGRKRWLGMTFVTQLPQHLPDEVLGLINNFILHKITDTGVVNRLRRTIGGIDEGLWNRLPNLAPGQAIVSMSSMTRPLLVSIDPTPCKLRMID